MKNYNIILFALTTIFLIFFNIFSVLKLKKSREYNKQIVEELRKSEGKVQFFSNTIKTRDYLKFKTEDLQLNFNSIVTTLNRDSLVLKNIIGEGSKMVFMFSDENCPPCVELELDRITKVSEIIGNSNIVILASYRNLRHLKLLQQQKNLSFKIYNTNKGVLNFPIELRYVPFLFITDSSRKAKLIFIPDKTLPELSEQYYQIVKNRFFTK